MKVLVIRTYHNTSFNEFDPVNIVDIRLKCQSLFVLAVGVLSPRRNFERVELANRIGIWCRWCRGCKTGEDAPTVINSIEVLLDTNHVSGDGTRVCADLVHVSLDIV